MQKALENLAATVTPNASKVVVDLGTTSGNARAAIRSAFSLSSLPGQGWTLHHADGTSAVGGWLDGLSTANTGILYIPTFGNARGDLDGDEMAAINARAAQINNYVAGFGDRSQGGALFSMSQSGRGASGWLNTLLPDATVTDLGGGGVGTPITLTPEGELAFPGLTSADTANAVPWHNYFTGDLGGLTILGTAPQGTATRNIILGGGAGTVITPMPIPGDLSSRPGPASLVPMVGMPVDLKKPTIVLTHGWQFTLPEMFHPVMFDPDVSPLAIDPDGPKDPKGPEDSLLAAVKNQLCTSEECTANVFTFQWQNAYTFFPSQARNFAEAAGAKLANQLLRRLGSEYAEKIHLVGHSYGSLVSSSAAAALKDDDPLDFKPGFSKKFFDVDQLTFLDAPVRIGLDSKVDDLLLAAALIKSLGPILGRRLALEMPLALLGPSTFYNLLPTGTVEYVDNFYGEGFSAFGDSLTGAAPDGGEGLSGEDLPGLLDDHSTIHYEFYAPRVRDENGRWITAVIEDRYATRPGPETWSPPTNNPAQDTGGDRRRGKCGLAVSG